jgi:CubicO group peptidase (beta-lactamase class C family)
VRTRLAVLIVCLALALNVLHARQSQLAVLSGSVFESYLESLRLQANIPGMSATLLQEGEVVWERGFGFQNQETRLRATPDTPYPIADLSQTIAAVLVLQCAEERRLGIDDPMRRYAPEFPDESATVRQVLSHSAAPPSGETFHYDPERYAQLTPVVEACIPQPYRKSVAVSVLERLAMKDSVPGRDVMGQNAPPQERLFATEVLERYKKVLDRVAVPYRVEKRGRLVRSDVTPEGINAATGLVSTVRDLARFDAALDDTILLKDETKAVAWTNMPSPQRGQLPTGLGWFVQSYRGEPVVWHFGLVANAYSSLIVKLPNRRLTFILLANSDGLSAPFQLDAGDVTRSLFAMLFLRLYT